MEGCSILLLLLAAIIAVVGWRRLSRRLTATETRLAELELDLGRLRSPAPQPAERPSMPEPPATAPPAVQPPSPHEPKPPAVPEPHEPRAVSAPVPGSQPAAARTGPSSSATDPGVAPPAAPSSPPPSRPAPIRIDWERWIGVRGAAVLGAVVLALAALLFLKYSIEHGLIPPIVRVIAGALAGVGSIWGGEALRKRTYVTQANALAGAGVVILYASFWAAHRLYGLIPASVGYGLMILVTVACGALAWRHRSLVIAVLGLVGGFATPLLLSTEADNPIGLFGYILVLDTGLLFLAQRRRWPILALLGFLATVFYQALWIFFEMEPARMALGLVILGVFAALFALSGARFLPRVGKGERSVWQLNQAGAVLVPFVFALYFAGNAELGIHLWPVAALLLMLSLAAEWIGRTQDAPLIGIGAAAADLAVVAVWFFRTPFDGVLAWEAVAITVLLSLAFHLFVEVDLRRLAGSDQATSGSKAALVAAAGFFALLVLASLGRVPSFWPWLLGWSLLAVLLVRQALLPALSYRQLVAAGLLGTGFALFFSAQGRTLALPPPALFFALVVGAGALFQLLALRRREAEPRRLAELAAAMVPLIVLVALLPEASHPSLVPALFYATSLVLTLLVLLVATRLGEGRLVLAVMGLLAFEHMLWSTNYRRLEAEPETALLALGAQLLAVGVFVVWPFLTARRFNRDRWVWYSSALAGPAWFLSLKEIVEQRFGDGLIGLLPLALGAVSLVAAYRSRDLWPAGDPRRKSRLAWFAAVALGFLSVAIPLQLEKEWITVGWALEGLAVIALWKRLDHPGLKYFGLALLAAVTVRLVANPALFGYYPRTAWPVFNWLMYTYLVPAAALIGCASILYRLEVERALDWEKSFYAHGRPIAAIACGLATIVVVFVWINLTIFDAFSPGSPLSITLDRQPARDLTLSLAWAVYALVLLALGMARSSQGLRWISLAFLVLTIGKVFLYDLGELDDLYRVASLVGLAISLILVSLAYQRFVFGGRSEEKK